ncbi:iron-sulfur cluster assembly accessory protein [Yoonia maricola]|uniref:Iron-sulfur cluster assembly accessory protein n=2 Tax=Yoonia maricola TaxID=420999 RepID=A0A2M8WMB5_9RHOB|nr:iron-sulfur cluster assembly accessory protein [Yoonia maricola]
MIACLVAFACHPYIAVVTEPIGLQMFTVPPKVTTRAFERLAEIGASAQGKALRVAVEGGGCSGFQYEIDLDEARDDDLVLSEQGEKVVIDSVSLPFLADAVIDFSEELIGARFVINNPNATSSCGCGTSFSM